MIVSIVIGLLFVVNGGSSSRIEHLHDRLKRAIAVVGGEAADIIHYPYLVQIHYKYPDEKEDRCGGAAVGQRWALTAAHCIKDFETAPRYLVWDSTIWNPWNENPNVPVDCTKDCYIHPQYVDRSHDLALIYLKGPHTFGQHQLIHLSESTPPPGTKLNVAGWGKGPEESMMNQLHEVTVPVVKIETCNASYEGEITQYMLCAGYDEGGKDACSGDSGGPAVARDSNGLLTVYGITSFGFLCAKPRYYGVYVDVATERTWIETTMASISTSDRPTESTGIDTTTTLMSITDTPIEVPIQIFVHRETPDKKKKPNKEKSTNKPKKPKRRSKPPPRKSNRPKKRTRGR